jgi:outer membrane protein assembly factor BamB
MTIAFKSHWCQYLTLLTFVTSCCAATNLLAQWPEFLGPGGNPVIVSGSLPDHFDVEKDGQASVNIAWRTSLPGRSVSSPIVADGKVFTTGSWGMEGRWQHVAAMDAQSGQILWQRAMQATGRPHCHPTSANAAPSPCTDGRQVYAFFSSNDLACYDLEGNLVWFRSLVDAHPLAGNDVGMSSSPVVVDSVVVAVVECQGDSFAVGIDSASGATLWELPRPRKANWSSPRALTTRDGQSLVLIHNDEGVVAVQPRNGKVVWTLPDRCSTIATAVAAGDWLFLPGDGLGAYRVTDGLTAPQSAWRSNRINPSSASPLFVESIGVLALNRSVLVCCDTSGQLQWQTRLPDAGQFWATPLVVGRRLYAFASSGKCFIVDLTETGGEVVGQSDLGTEVLGSPAADQDALYVRSVDALWKIQEARDRS